MGSTMSYYMHSLSFQSLIDYMNSYDSINYYENGSIQDVLNYNNNILEGDFISYKDRKSVV
jgi:antitoxin component YwqK of YwqJK toxin-antitoxin module